MSGPFDREAIAASFPGDGAPSRIGRAAAGRLPPSRAGFPPRFSGAFMAGRGRRESPPGPKQADAICAVSILFAAAQRPLVEFEARCEALRALEAIQAKFLPLSDERRKLSSELADALDVVSEVRDALASLRVALGFDPMQLFPMQGDATACKELRGGSFSEYPCIDKARVNSVANALFIEWEGDQPVSGRSRDSWMVLRYFCKAMIGEAEKLPNDSKARLRIIRICEVMPRVYIDPEIAWRELLDRLAQWPESVELFERVVGSLSSREA